MPSKDNKDTALAVNEKKDLQTIDLSGFDDLKAAAGEAIHGLEQLDASDIRMPKFTILQPTSPQIADGDGKYRAGQFLDSSTGEAVDTLQCILMNLTKQRVRWPKPFKRGQQALCRSLNHTTSETGIVCQVCPYGKWTNAKDGKPDCLEQYAFTGITDFEGVPQSPFRFIAQGSSIAPVKDFLTFISTKLLPLYVYRLELTTERKKNEQGTFYVVNIKVRGVIAVEDKKRMIDTADGLQKLYTSRFQKEDLLSSEGAVAETAGALPEIPDAGALF